MEKLNCLFFYEAETIDLTCAASFSRLAIAFAAQDFFAVEP